MAGPSKCRTILENQLYAKQKKQLGDAERIDDALVGAIWAASHMGEDFPVVFGTDSLRLVKTEALKRKSGGTIRLQIWFTILNENEVELLSIESIKSS